MDLPIEIRRKIYVYVLGNQLIHFGTRFSNGSQESDLAYWVCQAKPLRQQSGHGHGHYDAVALPPHWLKSPESIEPVPYNEGSVEGRIWDCYAARKASWSCCDDAVPYIYSAERALEWYRLDPSEKQRKPPAAQHLSLGLLRTCRSEHEETCDVLWSTNVLSFDGPSAFHDLMSRLSKQQKRRICYIHFTIEAFNASIDIRYWKDSFNAPHTKVLRSLKLLHVTFVGTGNLLRADDNVRIGRWLKWLKPFQQWRCQWRRAGGGALLRVPILLGRRTGREDFFPDTQVAQAGDLNSESRLSAIVRDQYMSKSVDILKDPTNEYVLATCTSTGETIKAKSLYVTPGKRFASFNTIVQSGNHAT